MTPSSAFFPRALIVTGGTSGIGAALVTQAAARGYGLVFGGSRPAEGLDSSLQPHADSYVQVDVSDDKSVERFRDTALSRLPSPDQSLLVVASAGVSARGNSEAIEEMSRINVGGTRHLLHDFGPEMRQRPGSCFVGVGSIVAAEGVAVKGDEAYQETKRKIHWIITEEVPMVHPGLKAFTLIPGAVDTPMTRKEMIFPMLLLGLVTTRGNRNNPLVNEAGLAGFSNAVVLRTFLMGALKATEHYQKIHKALEGDPDLGRVGKVVFLNRGAKDPAIVARAAEILTGLDVVITPDIVARAVLNQFESGTVPEQGMLKVYSRDGSDPILGLLGSFG